MELAGGPKPRMRIGALIAWVYAVWRRRIDLGRIHIACGEPIHLDGQCDVGDVSWEVIERLREASAITSYHLEAYLAHYSEDGMDAAALRSLIEERGGKVLESRLRPPADLHPLIAGTLHQQFAHFLA